jgi:hypothetical protein
MMLQAPGSTADAAAMNVRPTTGVSTSARLGRSEYAPTRRNEPSGHSPAPPGRSRRAHRVLASPPSCSFRRGLRLRRHLGLRQPHGCSSPWYVNDSIEPSAPDGVLCASAHLYKHPDAAWRKHPTHRLRSIDRPRAFPSPAPGSMMTVVSETANPGSPATRAATALA